MPRIPDAPVHIPQRPGGQMSMRVVSSAEADTGVGRSMMRLGGAVEALAAKWQQEKDTDDLVEAQNVYTQKMSEWMAESEKTRTGKSAEGFTKDFKTKHSEISEEISGGMNNRVQRFFNNWATGREAQGTEQSVRYEHQQMQLYGQDVHNQRMQQIVNTIEQNPGQWRDAMRQAEESFVLAVGQGVFRKEEAAVESEKWRDKLKGVAFENMYAKNRGAAMSSLKEFGFSLADQEQLKKKFKADQAHDAALANQGRNEQVKLLSGQLKDAVYMAENSGNTKAMVGIADKLAKLGRGKEAEKIRLAASVIDNNYAAIKEVQADSVPEAMRKTAALATTVDALGKAGTNPEEYVKKSRELELRQKALKNKISGFETDPAAMAAPVAVGETGQQQLQSRLNIQADNGVPISKRKVLSKEESSQMRGQFESLNIDAQVGFAQGIVTQYGSLSPKVFAELGLDSVAQTALQQASIDPVGQAANARTVLTVNNMKLSELPKVDGAAKLTREAMELSKKYQYYTAMIESGQASNPSLLRQREEHASFLEKAVAHTGDPSKAAALLDGAAGFAQTDDIVVSFDPSKISEQDVERGLSHAKNGAPMQAFLKTMDTRNDHHSEALRDHMVRNGVWQDAPDGNGFVLIDPVAQAPFRNNKGEYLRQTVEDIKAGSGEVKEEEMKKRGFAF